MSEYTTRNGATVDDRRSDEERAQTRYLVIATDSFMSGWGKAEKGRSLFAVPCKDHDEALIVLDNMQHRSEMKRCRIVKGNYTPALSKGDHYSIRHMSGCSRFYAPGGFRE